MQQSSIIKIVLRGTTWDSPRSRSCLFLPRNTFSDSRVCAQSPLAHLPGSTLQRKRGEAKCNEYDPLISLYLLQVGAGLTDAVASIGLAGLRLDMAEKVLVTQRNSAILAQVAAVP